MNLELQDELKGLKFSSKKGFVVIPENYDYETE